MVELRHGVSGMKLRKIIFLFILTVLICSLSGCGNDEVEPAEILEMSEETKEKVSEEKSSEEKVSFNMKIIIKQ